MAFEQTYDVVVIGGGPVGENVADRAARTGLATVVVEAELVGGECSYWACMPSKALLRPGAVRDMATGVPGIEPLPGIDPGPVLRARDAAAAGWNDAGQEEWLDSAGISLVRGHARLAGTRLVEVTSDVETVLLRARHAVVLATGSVPVLPDIPGLAEAEPWGSREATSAQVVPASLAIIGGGVVAVEMATAFADLGAQVSVISRGRLLARAEPWAGEAVADALRASDVRLIEGEVSQVRRDGSELVLGVGAEEVRAERVLVATGRVPRTQDLGLHTVGLDENAPLRVDDALRVIGAGGHNWLFAAGDVAGRAATTHQGKYEGRAVGDLIAATFGADTAGAPTEGDTPPSESPLPWSRYAATADTVAATQVVFSRPQVAWVGRTEASAKAAGIEVDVVSQDLSAAAGTSLMGPGYSGRAQLVIDRARQVVVGATFVGPEAGEMLHAATIAIAGEVTVGRLWHAVPAYPTVSEVWLRLLEAYGL